MTTFLAFAVVVSILVVVHELGHHLMAKWFRVPVEVFSVGFGPRLLAFRRGETEYRLSAIPFGGYVKMTGMSSKRGETTSNGFDSKARWQRFLILLAGPAMNIILAVALISPRTAGHEVALVCQPHQSLEKGLKSVPLRT